MYDAFPPKAEVRGVEMARVRINRFAYDKRATDRFMEKVMFFVPMNLESIGKYKIPKFF